MSIICVHQLTRRYGRRTGIRSIDLDVPEGALFGFLGPNGAGKTTLIRVLLGFLRPTEGRAHVFGLDCWRRSHRIKRHVGYLPGDLRLYPWMTARSAADIVGRIRGRDLMPRALDLCDRFHLDPGVLVRKMSRGMRQKLGLILALAPDPQLLVLDEPTSGLDPLMRIELARHLREMAARGHTVFFSSHTLSEVEQLCDRVAIVRAGRIVADERIEDMRLRARRQVVIQFADTASAKSAQPPPFLDLSQRKNDRWHAQMDGPAGPLIQWLANHAINDLSIGQPDLETLFKAFYQTPEE